MTDRKPEIVLLAAIILIAGCSAMTTIVHDVERVAQGQDARYQLELLRPLLHRGTGGLVRLHQPSRS